MEWYSEAKAYLSTYGYYRQYRVDPPDGWQQDQIALDAQQTAIARLGLLVVPTIRRVVNQPTAKGACDMLIANRECRAEKVITTKV